MNGLLNLNYDFLSTRELDSNECYVGHFSKTYAFQKQKEKKEKGKEIFLSYTFKSATISLQAISAI